MEVAAATFKTLRYSQLSKEMANITDAVLASTLKKLMENNIVQRKSYDEIPPRVEYSLTKKGQSIVPILQQICGWSGLYYRKNSKAEMAHCKKCNFKD